MASYHFDPINILDTANATGVGTGGSMTLGGGISIGKDTYIGGNLNVSGTNTTFVDNIIILNANPNASYDTGILLQRYESDVSNNDNYSGIIYSETLDEFIFGYATSDVRGTISLNRCVPIRTAGIIITGGSLNSTFNSNTIGSIITTGGNVGINTSAPNFKLDVQGDIQLSGDFYKNGVVYTPGSQWTSFSNNIAFTSGYIGIGTTSPSTILHVNGSALVSESITSASAQLTNVSSTHITSATLNLTTGITSAGAQITTLLNTNAVSTNITSSTLNLSVSLIATGNSNTIGNIITTGGNVGIGRTTPTYTLDVNGSVNIGGNSKAYIMADANIGDARLNIRDFSNRFIDFYHSSTTVGSITGFSGTIEGLNFNNGRMVLDSRGNIGIGTISPVTNLDVNGSAIISIGLTTGNIVSATATISTLGSGWISSTTITGGTISLSGNINVAGNAIIAGDLTISGTTTTINTITTIIEDNLIVLNSGPAGLYDGGIMVQRTTGSFAALFYSAGTDEFQIVQTASDPGSSPVVVDSYKGLRIGSLVATNNSNTVGSIITTGGNVGIGTTSPTRLLQVGINNGTQGSISVTTNGEARYHLFNSQPVAEWCFGQKSSTRNDFTISKVVSNVESDFLTISTDGRVGISTTSPATTLHVVGSAIFSIGITTATLLNTNAVSTNITSATLNLTTGITTATLLSTNAVSTNITSSTLNLTTGITSASAQFSNANIITSTIANAVISNISSATLNISNSITATGNSNTLGSLFTTAGNVGIGTTNPSYELHVAGTIHATGDITAFSDMRVKSNIRTIHNALDKVLNLRGVYYKSNITDRDCIGVIAQEIEDIIPEVVLTDTNGFKSVSYGNIVSMLIEAIKEQNEEIQALKKLFN
jgi:hypothetical protein